MPFHIPSFDMNAFVRATLAEDLGPTGRDVTSESVIPADLRFDGVMDSRDAITVAGLPIAVAFFKALDPLMEIELLVEEGKLKKMWVLRRILMQMGTIDAMEFLLDKMKDSKTNEDFFDSMNQ